jgi:hypothetical protein
MIDRAQIAVRRQYTLLTITAGTIKIVELKQRIMMNKGGMYLSLREFNH